MNLLVSKKWLGGFFVALIAIIVVSSAGGRVIDPQNKSPSNQWMELVAGALDKIGVNVAFGNSAAIPLDSEQDAILSPLNQYTPRTSAWGSFQKEDWQRGFRKGVMSVLIITQPTSKSRVETYQRRCMKQYPKLSEYGCKFVSSWNESPKDRRIFLAFTSSDAEKAFAVKNTLERSGYVVFVFLDEKTSQKWATPSMVGEIFATAGQKFVLDTKNSRGSAGVEFEKQCEAWLSSAPDEFEQWPFSSLIAAN